MLQHKCSNCPVYNSVLRTPSNPAEIHGAYHNARICTVYGQSIMISRSLKVIPGQCHILSMAYCKDHSIARLHEANARLHGQCYVDVDRHICILWQRGQVSGATWAIFDWYICTKKKQMIGKWYNLSSNSWALPSPNGSNQFQKLQTPDHLVNYLSLEGKDRGNQVGALRRVLRHVLKTHSKLLKGVQSPCF